MPGARARVPPARPTGGSSRDAESCAISVGLQRQGDRPAQTTQLQGGQEPSQTGAMQIPTANQMAMEEETRQDAPLLEATRQGRPRRLPGWSRDYEMF